MKIQIEIGSFGSERERMTSEHNMTKMEGVASLRLSWKYSIREAKAVSRDGRIATSKKSSDRGEKHGSRTAVKIWSHKNTSTHFISKLGFIIISFVLFVYNNLTHGVKLLRASVVVTKNVRNLPR